VIDKHELGAWLRLLESPQLGRESARRLLAAFGSPQAAIEATEAARREVVGPSQAAALTAATDQVEALVAATFAWLEGDAPEPRAVIMLGDPR
jgi:DNA processing protein